MPFSSPDKSTGKLATAWVRRTTLKAGKAGKVGTAGRGYPEGPTHGTSTASRPSPAAVHADPQRGFFRT